MAKVYSVRVAADFLILADDEQDARTIASVLTDGINSELPGDSVVDLYPYLVQNQTEGMRRQCVNYEGHADSHTSSSNAEKSNDR